jgi:hypothetical protein
MFRDSERINPNQNLSLVRPLCPFVVSPLPESDTRAPATMSATPLAPLPGASRYITVPIVTN